MFRASLDIHLIITLTLPLAVIGSLLRCGLRVLHPLVVRAVLHFRRCDTLHSLADKADKVMSPQRVLPPPLPSLPLLALEHLLVSDRLGLRPQVLAHGQQVEPDLGLWVSRDTGLEDRHDCIGEDLSGTCADIAVSNRCGLQTVDLVECAVDGGVCDEVVDVVVPGCYAGLVAYEW